MEMEGVRAEGVDLSLIPTSSSWSSKGTFGFEVVVDMSLPGSAYHQIMAEILSHARVGRRRVSQSSISPASIPHGIHFSSDGRLHQNF